jgi:hypothetical protein
MKTYEKSVSKRLVQKLLYNHISNGIQDAVVLLGPTPDNYLEILTSVLGNGHIYNYEKDINTNINISKPIDNLITTSYQDVFYVTPKSLMDIDLINTYKSDGYLIKHLFAEQQRVCSQCFMNYFLFTVSMRGIPEKENLVHFLSELLQDNVSLKDYVNMPNFIKEYHFKATNRRYDIFAYGYRGEDKNDQNRGSRMMSVLIKY